MYDLFIREEIMPRGCVEYVIPNLVTSSMNNYIDNIAMSDFHICDFSMEYTIKRENGKADFCH